MFFEKRERREPFFRKKNHLKIKRKSCEKSNYCEAQSHFPSLFFRNCLVFLFFESFFAQKSQGLTFRDECSFWKTIKTENNDFPYSMCFLDSFIVLTCAVVEISRLRTIEPVEIVKPSVCWQIFFLTVTQVPLPHEVCRVFQLFHVLG